MWRIEDDREDLARRGAVRAEDAAAYAAYVERTGIEGFAGQDIDKAVFYPEDDQYLIERDLTVRHYEVAGDA